MIVPQAALNTQPKEATKAYRGHHCLRNTSVSRAAVATHKIIRERNEQASTVGRHLGLGVLRHTPSSWCPAPKGSHAGTDMRQTSRLPSAYLGAFGRIWALHRADGI